MLELIMVLSAVLRKFSDLAVVGALLVVNAVLSFVQEHRAAGVVEALRKRLQVSARVRRESSWQVIPARELVPGDVVRVRPGDIVPADVKLLTGALSIDESALTGESKDADKTPGGVLSSGSIVRRGEGNGVVILTGAKTYFGRTTELVQEARPQLHIEAVVAKVVRWLFVIVGALLCVVIVLSLIRGTPVVEMIPLMLVLLMSRRTPRKRVIGTLEEHPTKKAAENAARVFRLNLVDRGSATLTRITMQELVKHFSEHEQVDNGDEGRAYSTRDRCESVLNCWILPRWGKTAIDQIRTVAVEQWLRAIPRANGTKSKIRNTMSALYNHAIRWEFTDKNPITGPVRGSGVRQSAKRERIPDVLEVEEFQRLQAELGLRERILVWLDMTLGLRRGELAGLRWEDIRFEDLTVMARRSIVDQVVGNVKTEASKRPVPIDPFVAEDLLTWYRTTKYSRPADYVFATDAPRAGKKRGKQPVWLSKVMSYHVQPAALRAGITKHIGWHTFRHTYTTLLHANGEDVKVVQELLRHGSAKITMDVYAQAVTPAKRKAQGKIVAMLRDTTREKKSG